MTHHQRILELLNERPYVRIADFRQWCDYRKRISELRHEGHDIRPLVVVEAGVKVRAYSLFKEDARMPKFKAEMPLISLEPPQRRSY